jgi:peptidoglycan-associated lipoprotein
MTMLGVNPSQMELISFGKERPAVEGSGEPAWSKNRRDEFRVISGR